MICQVCSKAIKELFCHCKQCDNNYCMDCKVAQWTCTGNNHVVRPWVCGRCFSEHGVLYKGKYYCNYCEPKDKVMKQFKRACYLYAENNMPIDYINDRKHAELFHMDPLSTIMSWKPKYPDPITFSLREYWIV